MIGKLKQMTFFNSMLKTYIDFVCLYDYHKSYHGKHTNMLYVMRGEF